MKILRIVGALAALFVLSSSLGIEHAGASSRVEAPPTPAMPAHWKVVSDVEFDAIDIRPVANNLGAEVSALRNTTYDVSGMKVKLNTIVAPTSNAADSIMRALESMKPSEWIVRRGLVIYEFVGTNQAIPEMRTGRLLLDR